jgi:hypothetical protein
MVVRTSEGCIVARRRTFNPQSTLEAARSGELTGVALRKAIKIADEFGNADLVAQLRVSLVQPASFAADAATPEIRDRVAQGVSALGEMGKPSSRTVQSLRRDGVVETINRIAPLPESKENFDRLREAGLEHLTAEAIVFDHPGLFSEEAVALSKKRLGR